MDIARRPLILLVDEDCRSGRRLARLLEDDGFEVEIAGDGASAIARLSREPVPDGLVTDHYMAHADGLAVTRYARTQRPAIATVVVTEHAELASGPARALTPPLIVLAKPVSYDVLVRTLQSQLRAVGARAPNV